jgi:hypothetical protein
MRGRHVVSFKAEQPMVNSQDYYVRFLLIEESFDSEDDARRRLSDIHRPVPDRPSNEYELTMRDGLRVETKTYVLQTDALIFWDEVRNLTKVLLGSIDGAEPPQQVAARRKSWLSAEQRPAAASPMSSFLR